MNFKSLMYLGHSAVKIDYHDFVLAVDPWLEGNPLCPDKHKNPSKLDLIILTHGHFDHAGDAVRLAKNCGSLIIATWELANLIVKEGVSENQVIPMNKGGSIEHSGLRIALTQAFHSSSFETPSGPAYAGEPCGVVVDDGSNCIYHAGDTALFSDMSLIGQIYKPKIALLPIGDRFTMGPREAAKAAELLKCKIAIPIHYKTFDMLTGSSSDFKKHCQGQETEVRVLEPGEAYS